MKKNISLLLAVVLVLALLPTVSLAAKPAEIHPELASVKVTCSSSADEYYFEDLSQAIISWICKDLPEQKTITLLQDTEVFSMSESNFFSTPVASALWYNKDLKAAKAFPIVLDLGGNTLSFYGGGNMFYFERFGINVKNGTLIYNNTAGKGRSPFCFGKSTGQTANSAASSCYDPVLNLENVHVYSTGPIATSYIYDTTINVTNSVLWSSGDTNAINFSKSSQEQATNVWDGPFQPQLNVKNSIVGSDKLYFLGSSEGTKVTVTDSIVVSNSTSNPIASSSKADVTFVGDKVLDKNWSMPLRDGRTVTGKAFTFGKAPATLPFSDVKTTDWFYEYVEELYLGGVVAGQTATTFNPNGSLTYGAALKLLVVGLTGNDPGNAASTHWAFNYLNIAKQKGWTDIDASKLDSPITRETFCVMAAKAKNLTQQPETNEFTDAANTSVLALVEAGVINGMSETTFQPGGILTRAQISKIISLLLKL